MDSVATTSPNNKDVLDRAENEAEEIISKRVETYSVDPKKAEHDAKIIKENLFEFIERVAKKLAKGLIDSIMFLYNAMVDPKTPLQVKLIAIAALIYLINPFDAIPDVLPGIGFADDAAAITAAVAAISKILLEHAIHLEEDKVKGNI